MRVAPASRCFQPAEVPMFYLSTFFFILQQTAFRYVQAATYTLQHYKNGMKEAKIPFEQHDLHA